ncbi:DUF5107 domain-containing protein [Flavivirga algicola]|uniref:DUF5107 domain-containing protein n=1 Tax=Flavivirga algicola TaxID=2729136 RepID=A0ABX1RTG8_9FLAO|nr:DUF5107 domain-containing protein [Flavivirga algicola]NMH86852.1 DUF5107 domain-containing protein [Flavivirga algicola]
MGKVKANLGKRIIPTYKLGKPEINPVFFEKRVYQGSNGKVYPVPFIDKVYDTKEDQPYREAVLENDYVRLSILPEIGGRIFEAQDKTNGNYDFFYKQDVIKPALVGLAGPWISGGVEFNWPQHHRPGTYLPTDVHIEHESDGAKTIWMSEYDPLNRLKGMHGLRLRPDSALIELRARLFNRTPFTQTFLWWANVAVEVHDNYESFFPSDVHYVADHAVRAQSSFPLAENDYYGIPYHKRKGANDLRRYTNIPVPTSYMVCETNYDFFGGYDHNAQGGFIHVANRHIAPGKKQWTWGNSEFGRAWDRELTDEGGPYFELMAGVYTDNQPDFSYLAPYETKTFSQFWWGYKNLGPVQNANHDVAIRLSVQEDNKLDLGVASTRLIEGIKIVLKIGDKITEIDNVAISPNKPWEDTSRSIQSGEENSISLTVLDYEGKELLSYQEKEISKNRNRITAKEPNEANNIEASSELNLIGEHLELYRHPTRYPEPYWESALEKNSNDYKAALELGKSELKKGRFNKALKRFKSAIAILTSYHPNPQTGEAHYFAGLTCLFQNRPEEAYSLLYKATWNYAWRSSSHYLLANIESRKGNTASVLHHIEASLDTNRQNNKAYILKAIILSGLQKAEEAKTILQDILEIDPLDQWAKYELGRLSGDCQAFLDSSRNDAQTIIDIAFDYADAGYYSEAIELIELHHDNLIPDCAVPNPLKQSVITWFVLAWLYAMNNETDTSKSVLAKASALNPDYCFPSRIHEQIVLEWAIQQEANPSLAAYGLGNYLLDKKCHTEAIAAWEIAAKNEMKYGTLYRNLGIAYWNTKQGGEKAREAFKKAIEFSPEDMRILFEYDQLRKKLNDKPEERLAFIKPKLASILERDDFSVELAALYNFTGQYDEAMKVMQSKNFHPWEGGEGQVIRQYTYTCLRKGQEALVSGSPEKALEYFNDAENTPDNLGEKYHPLQAKAHLKYWQGKALKASGKSKEAKILFQQSATEEGDFIDMAVSAYSELSYYSALSLIEMNKNDEAMTLLNNIKDYAKNKLEETVKIDYFATSLPLLLVFEDDMQKRNTWDNKFLLALSEFGLGNKERALNLFNEVLTLNAMHVGAREFIDKITAEKVLL